MNTIDRIEKNTNDFRIDILEIEHFLTGTRLSYNFFKIHFPGIQEDFKKKNRSDDEKEGMEMFKNLESRIESFESDVYSITFINLIARTEAYLNDILETLFLWKKKSLISDKTLSYKEIIESNNIDDVINKIREDAILEFSHLSFRDKLKFLEKKFKLSIPSLDEHLDSIIELFTTRNIILHNNGIVNKVYLKINKNSKFILGTKRIIDENYIKYTFALLILVSKSLDEKIKEKIKNASS